MGILTHSISDAAFVSPTLLAQLPLSNPVLIFTLLMLVILVAPMVAGRLRLPGLIGLILAGLILGPNALNVIDRGDTMQLFGAIGLLYIMFIAGVEINLGLFNKYKVHSVLFGACTFLLPQVLGTIVALRWLDMSWPTAILLASMFASHTLVSFPIVGRFGLMQSRAVICTVGATLVTDTAALLVLAVIAASAQGSIGATFWLQLAAALVVFVWGVLYILPRVGQRFFRNVAEEGSAQFLFVLAAVFGCGYLAQAAGVEPIIGAFLAGLALNRLVPEHSSLMNRIQFMGNVLFIPMFLISVGMLVDVRVLWGGPWALLVSGTMVFTVIATKWMAARLSQVLLGYSPAEGWLMFGLSVNQAAATLAAVVVGMRIGLFDEAVLNGAIVMILATCMLGPWITERYGRQIALTAEEPAYQAHAPQRILVPLARPESAGPLLDLAFLLRPPRTDEPIHLLTVVPDGPDVQAGVAGREKALSLAVIQAAAAEVPVQSVIRVDANIADGISRAVKELRISQVIIGWRGDVSTRERIFGSVLDQFLAQSSTMLMVCKSEHPINTIDRVILAVPPFGEREPGFDDALLLVRRLADQIDARLVVLATEPSLSRIRRRVARASGPKPTFQALAGWGDLLPTLATLLTPDDLLVLQSAREGRLSWSPALPRTPQRLSQEFPRTGFIVLYPGEVEYEVPPAAAVRPVDATAAASLARLDVTMGLDAMPHDRALEQMVVHAFPDQPDHAARAVTLVRRAAREYAAGIADGAVLVHAHGLVDRPLLLVGLSRDGLSFPTVSRPVHVVLLLLEPEDQPSGQHLQMLASVAQLVHHQEVVARLKTAGSGEEVLQVLSESAGLHPSSTVPAESLLIAHSSRPIADGR